MNQICEQCIQPIIKYRKGQRFCGRICTAEAKKISSALADPDFFSDDNVSDEFKSYYAGFFYADGCYSISNNCERITLSMNDKDMIHRMALIVSPGRKVYTQKPKSSNHAIGYSIINRNPGVVDQFKRWGVSLRKSPSMTLPVDYQYDMRHFVRGYFDGDGSVYNSSVVKGKTYKGMSFTTGSLAFAEQLAAFMSGFDINFRLNKDSRHNAYYLRLNKQKEIGLMRDFMYDDAKWYLPRKFVKFDDIV